LLNVTARDGVPTGTAGLALVRVTETGSVAMALEAAPPPQPMVMTAENSRPTEAKDGQEQTTLLCIADTQYL
jgi:hypothetical protein